MIEFIMCLTGALLLLSSETTKVESHSEPHNAVATDVKKSSSRSLHRLGATEKARPVLTIRATLHAPDVARPRTDAASPWNAGKSTTYVAVAGDTVSKLALRFLGANTRENRNAIVALNSTLRPNPNLLIIGKTYLIPKRAKSPARMPD